MALTSQILAVGSVPLVVGLTVSLYLVYAIYQRYFSPLAGIPGPFLGSFSQLWLLYHGIKGDMHIQMIKLHAKHGKLVRTGPNEIDVVDAEAVHTIFRPGSKFRKADWYIPFQGQRKFDMLSERDEKVHGAQRRIISGAYSMTSLRDLEVYVDRSMKTFMGVMKQFEGKAFDLGYWFKLLAFDVIGEVTFSKRFGFLDMGADDGMLAQIEMMLHSLCWVTQVPWVWYLNEWTKPWIGNKLYLNNRHTKLFEYTAREVQNRMEKGGDDKDILSKLRAAHLNKPDQFDRRDLIGMVGSNIGAGSDTTASAFRGIMYHLLKTPEAKRKLVEELDFRKREGKISDPITFLEANEIPYLQAVMNEGMRLAPSVGLGLPRRVPAGGLEVDGHHIPEGRVVSVNAWAHHVDKDVYGPDAESFRPERWMEENVGDLHRNFLTFGGQNRLCLGRNISWMEISKMLPMMLLKYDLAFEDDNEPFEQQTYFVMFGKMPQVILTPRHLD